MNSFNRKRLDANNIQKYMMETYPELFITIKDISGKRLISIPALLQKDYGGLNDCTLTSMTAFVMFLKQATFANDIYKVIESLAKQYGYTGSKGTNPFLIKRIFDSALIALKIKRETKVRFIKNIGYNFNLIKQTIDAGTPIILSMYSDGRNYYSNHSVLIVGYREYSLNNSKKAIRFLMVQDNWNKNVSFIDYEKLSIVSSINY